MIHSLKCEKQYFDAVLSGRKSFEVRINDRDFAVGDFLALNEITGDDSMPDGWAYTERSCLVEVDYILQDEEYLQPGYVCMAIKPCAISRRKNNPNFVKDVYEVPAY